MQSTKDAKLPHLDWWTDILILSIFLFIFYFLWLDNYPVFIPDEARYSEIAREMVVEHDYITPKLNGSVFLDKPILHYWLQAFAINWYGIKEWALRFFPAFFAIMNCLILYICARKLYDRHTAILSTLILATSPLFFGAAHFANLDLEVSFFISCSLLCFLTAFHLLDKASTLYLLAGYVFIALGFLTKGMIGLFFPLLIILIWLWLLEKKITYKQMKINFGIGIFVIIVLPWYILVQNVNPDFLRYFFITQQVTRFLSSGEFNNKNPWWFYFPVLIIGFFPWSLFLMRLLSKKILNFTVNIKNTLNNKEIFVLKRYAFIFRTNIKKCPIAFFLLLWMSVLIIFFSIPQSKTVGYILPIFPALALLIGHWLSLHWEHKKTNFVFTNALTYTISCGLLILILISLINSEKIDFSPRLIPYLKEIIIIFIASGLLSLILSRQKKILLLFSVCILTNVSSLFLLVCAAGYVNSDTTKPLVMYLKTVMHPEDEVINYFRYFYDVPLYLQKPVIVVANWNNVQAIRRDSWMRELWYGMQYPHSNKFLIDHATFWEHWYSERRIFVFMHVNDFVEFQPKVNTYFHLGRINDIVLISNKPTIEYGLYLQTQHLMTSNQHQTIRTTLNIF